MAAAGRAGELFGPLFINKTLATCVVFGCCSVGSIEYQHWIWGSNCFKQTAEQNRCEPTHWKGGLQLNVCTWLDSDYVFYKTISSICPVHYSHLFNILMLHALAESLLVSFNSIATDSYQQCAIFNLEYENEIKMTEWLKRIAYKMHCYA